MAGNKMLILSLMGMVMSLVVVANLDPALKEADAKPKIISVRPDGSGEFKTIMEAVKSIPEGNKVRTVLKLGPGTYKEKVIINRTKPFITLYGEDPKSLPIITFGDTAAKLGTWDSSSVIAESDYFVACNVQFENSAPMPKPGSEGGQAVAIRVTGDKAAFYSCKFKGFQDTLLDDMGKHYFQDCYIEGTVDYIFGRGKTIYKNCEIKTVAEIKDGLTFIVAQGRAGTEDSGFVFDECKVTGTGDAHLGRAWKEASRVIFANSFIDKLINAKGWDNFGHPEYNSKVYFGEYNCSGPGSDTNGRVEFAKKLTAEEVKPFLDMAFIEGSTWLQPAPKY